MTRHSGFGPDSADMNPFTRGERQGPGILVLTGYDKILKAGMIRLAPWRIVDLLTKF